MGGFTPGGLMCIWCRQVVQVNPVDSTGRRCYAQHEWPNGGGRCEGALRNISDETRRLAEMMMATMSKGDQR
jgi:hypothetical protein